MPDERKVDFASLDVIFQNTMYDLILPLGVFFFDYEPYK
jgi:hypothetical protein